ncbi:MAG: hypothetical protein PHI28_15400 [Mangrovibacterium sp.]|nr:hypothetical protein [Mangrovibacterium sp.]
MTKKNGGKVIQMLTPENYIRKRSRDLPVWECLINADWEKSGMANVVVARRHANGNITYCLYMVDLLCLGVKDTLFSFNTPLFEYKEFVEEKMEHLKMITINYTLAHNVVYAAVEFAEEYGFKPHKDFIATTRYHLSEDNEEVELIDIGCGRDGKPLYVQGPFDNSQKVKQTIAQLDRTAGPGNYDYILAGDEGRNDEQDDDEDEWDEDKE